MALLQGMPNASLERAGLLWDASRVLRAHPELMDAVAKGEVPSGSPAAEEFAAKLGELQQRFGSTGEGFVEDQPTWGEDASVPLAAIRAYASQPDGRGPLDSARTQESVAMPSKPNCAPSRRQTRHAPNCCASCPSPRS